MSSPTTKKELKTKKLNSKLMYDIKYKYNKNVDEQEYLWLTAFCSVCHLNEPDIIEIHHIDKNRKNNKLSNLIGLCPNCHKRVHRGRIDIISIKGNHYINVKMDIKEVDF